MLATFLHNTLSTSRKSSHFEHISSGNRSWKRLSGS
jgi:hypothetical protein